MNFLSEKYKLCRVVAPQITEEEETMAAKKDKKARRLARKRKTQRSTQPSSGQQILLKRAQTSEHLKNAKVIRNTGEMEKMSEVILRFAEPLQDEYGVVPPNMIQLAIFVWNASLLPKEAQQKAIKDMSKIIPVTEREARREMILAVSMLLERKEKHFADNKRFIMDYQITETARRINLDVVSTIAEGYDPDLEAARYRKEHTR